MTMLGTGSGWSDSDHEESAGVELDDDEHRWWGPDGAEIRRGRSCDWKLRTYFKRGDPRNPKG